MSDGDFDFEPIAGLPQMLPEGERLLWQGRPDRWRLALDAFRLRWLVAYIAALALWRISSGIHDGETMSAIAISAASASGLGIAGLALLLGIGWLMAGGTVYSITSKRLVIRHGVAMPMAINVPFASIDSAGFRANGDGTGDITLKLVPKQRPSYFALWPHARPLAYRHPEPMLRAIPDARTVAGIISEALAASCEQAPARIEPARIETVEAVVKPRRPVEASVGEIAVAS